MQDYERNYFAEGLEMIKLALEKECENEAKKVTQKLLNDMNSLKIREEINKLKEQLTGDMMQDMEIRDKIHNLEMKLNGTKPEDTSIDCIGCGS